MNTRTGSSALGRGPSRSVWCEVRVMAYIETISPRSATGEVADAYRYLATVLGADGFAASVVQAFSLRPASMRRMVRSWELAMWTGLQPRASRELLASLISRINDCHY